MYISMKHKFRPIYSILLLMLVPATFITRVFLQDGIFLTHSYDFTPIKTPKKPVFNSTLLRYAAVDMSEPWLKKEVEDLLDGSFRNRGRQRSFLSSAKYDPKRRSSRGAAAMLLRSPEFHRFWLSFRRHLGDWFRKRKYPSADAMLDLIGQLKPSIDGSKQKYKTCAVVGNSGILLKKNYGELIDGHEAVIRLNNARTAGFEPNVGSKTSISFINSNVLHLCARRNGCHCNPYSSKVPIVMYVCQPAHFFDYMACNGSHKAPLIVTDPRFDLLCSRIVKYYSLKRFAEFEGRDLLEWARAHEGVSFHYSSGMQAVMLAAGICEKVSIFGFGKSKSDRHHYHTNQKAELSLHDYEAEYDFYRDLTERPKAIPFVEKFEFPQVVMYR